MNKKVFTELWFGGSYIIIVKCSFVVLIPRKSLKEAEDFLSKPCIFGDHPGHGEIVDLEA